MFKKLLVTLSALSLALLIGCTSADSSSKVSFKTHDLDGNEYTQDIFAESEITILNVWGTFCGPCIYEMPDLGALSRECDPAKIQFVGVICDVTEDSPSSDVSYAKAIINDTNATYTHLKMSKSLNDWKFKDMQYVPTTLIVNSKGEVLEELVGARSKEEWKFYIKYYSGENNN